jgi:hypothetical protein
MSKSSREDKEAQHMADPKPNALLDAIMRPPAVTTREMESQVAFLESGASSTGMRAMRSAAINASGVTLNTRIHPDMAMALKRASFQRKLSGVEPNSLRDILEEALRPWLRQHGYLP